jgi:hypothetical protein
MNIEAFKTQNGYETEGFWLPRVTTITNIVSKPALFRYYAQHNNFMSAQNSLNHSASWGTAVHKAIEMLLKNKKHRPDEEILHSIGAFRDWQSQNRVKILDPENDIEKMIFDLDNFYAGTLDILAEVNGVLGILDIKTGSGIWDEYGLQLAAYMNAYNKNVPAKRRAKARWILRLDQFEQCTICGAKKRIKSGKTKITGGKKTCYHQFSQTKGAFEFKELKGFKDDLQGFLSAKKLWEWYNRNILKEIKNYPENKKTQSLF